MKKALLAASAVALLGGLASVGVPAAGADPVATAVASGYGANLEVAGTAVLDQEGLAVATVPPGQDVGPNAFLLAPVDPLVLSGTVVGQASAHVQSDLLSTLTVEQQGLAGPYNAVGVGFAENVGVLLAGTAEIPVTQALVSATAVRAEAVGVCVNGTPQYDATSEVIDLRVGETQVDAVNDLVADLLTTLNQTLEPLAQVVDIGLNETNITADGASVDALRVTVASLLGEPLAELIIGHAEVSGLTCAAADLPECSDGVDNDGDGVIDAQDPGCLTPDGVYDPNDDDERNECIDEVDNDGDGKIDFPNDPGCSSPQDDDERDGGGGVLARTGGDTSNTAPIALGLVAVAIGGLLVRRRTLV